MKTKDFIKTLQEADPSGEIHVRIRSPGEPTCAAVVPGYWDGCYSYEEDGGLVVTDKGAKVDVYCQEVDDFIWDQDGKTDNVKIEMHDPKGMRNFVEETGATAREFHGKMMKEMTDKVLAVMATGWKVVQDSGYAIGLCHKQWYVKDPEKFVFCDDGDRKDTDNQKKLCQGECLAVVYGGLFTHRNDGALTYWELKEATHV